MHIHSDNKSPSGHSIIMFITERCSRGHSLVVVVLANMWFRDFICSYLFGHIKTCIRHDGGETHLFILYIIFTFKSTHTGILTMKQSLYLQ